ncbi:MAG: hypothetical protein EOO61_17195 [Hymenobacter sp.]|nr:MAG: hypothetical protein EOO61_17195 [Hymenobacter sp.]
MQYRKTVWLLILGLPIVASACDFTNYQQIDDTFKFGYSNRRGYTNIYYGELGIIPGGCDQAKWDDSVIVARGRWRYHGYSWAPQKDSTEEFAYFIITKKTYSNNAAQELSSGFKGPLSEHYFKVNDPLPGKQFHGTSLW